MSPAQQTTLFFGVFAMNKGTFESSYFQVKNRPCAIKNYNEGIDSEIVIEKFSYAGRLDSCI